MLICQCGCQKFYKAPIPTWSATGKKKNVEMLLWQVPDRLFIHKLSALNTSIYKQHYSFVEKHLGCFNSLFIVNRLAVNITEQVSVE